MRFSAFNLMRSIHAWAGALLALILVLVCLTGTLLVWKHEYVEFRLRDEAQPFEPTPERLAAIGLAVEQQFDPRDVLQIQFATETFPFTKVVLVDAHYAYLNAVGDVVDRWHQNERFEEWVYDLHHRLLLGNTGLTILGIAALVLVAVAVLGGVVFWPMRRGFRRGIWQKGRGRPPWLIAHRNLGAIMLAPLLVILVTAALLAFPREAERWLLEPFRGEDYSLDFSDNVDDISGGDSGDWLPAIQRALAIFPDSRVRTSSMPSDMSPYRVIGLQQPGELNPQGRSQIYIDASEGWMDVRIDAHDQHVSERLYHLAYPLHTGWMDSIVYKIVLSLAGLGATLLGVFGLVAFVQPERWRARPPRR